MWSVLPLHTTRLRSGSLFRHSEIFLDEDTCVSSQTGKKMMSISGNNSSQGIKLKNDMSSFWHNVVDKNENKCDNAGRK